MYRNRKRFEREKNRIACNHLEHNTCLVNKDGLYRTMRAYCQGEGREPMDRFMPLTFHVTNQEDEEWTSFKAAFTKHATELSTTDLSKTIDNMKKWNARRKLKGGIKAVMASNRVAAAARGQA